MNRKRLQWLVAGIVVVVLCLLFWGGGQAREMARHAPIMGGQRVAEAEPNAMSPSAGGPMMGGKGRAPYTQDYDEVAKAQGPKPATMGTMAGSQEPDRYLIKNGVVTLEVKDARVAAQMLLGSVRASNGYVANLQETVDALGARTVSAQVRVPAKSFEPSLRSIETLGKVLNKNVTAEDVTEEYVDSTSRLRNLQRTEERLLSHLSKTGRLSDTLLVEKELARVREEIEKLQGRLRFLTHRVAFCTFDVTMSEAARQQALTNPQTFSSGKVYSDAVRSLVDFAQSVWSLIIWVAIWTPVWLAPVLLGVWLYRLAMRRAIAKDKHGAAE